MKHILFIEKKSSMKSEKRLTKDKCFFNVFTIKSCYSCDLRDAKIGMCMLWGKSVKDNNICPNYYSILFDELKKEFLQ